MASPRSEWPALIKFRRISRKQNAPLARLLLHCGSAEAALEAPASLWSEVCGFVPESERLEKAERRAASDANLLDRLGADVVDVRQPDYPEALRRLPQPPPILFVLGRVTDLQRPGIAVVGTRSLSAYGREATVSLVVGLVHAGYTIISGLARGIDSVAHRTALDVGGVTIAALGTGIDSAYPPEHRGLAARVAKAGCLVSEFPPGTPPRKHHFPQRNRLIAGLARGVLVVEAPLRSGALITAEYALEEGKDVFAVPGPIHSEASRGTNRLIQDGAALVTSAADLLGILHSRVGEPLPTPTGPNLALDRRTRPSRSESGASDLARRIWGALAGGHDHVDTLSAAVGSAPGEVAAALIELELAGLVERLPGGRFRQASTHARG